MRRCLFFDKRMKKGDLPHQLLPNSSVRDDDWNNYDSKEDGSGAEVAVHNAVLTFRHDAIHSLHLQTKFQATHPQEEEEDEQHDSDDHTPSLYTGYIQTHLMMKLTNLRPSKFTDGDDNDNGHEEEEQYQLQLRQQLCTQTWPGQLSLLNER